MVDKTARPDLFQRGRRTVTIWVALIIAIVLVGCNTPANDRQYLTVTGPQDQITRNAGEGRLIFWVGGCASCHATPGSGATTQPHLGGGIELDTPYGVFRVPNISSHETAGIGSWSETEFANAMLHGVSPSGEHYFPSFPYTSYARMTNQDIANLWAYLQTLPPVENKVAGHDMQFPFNSRDAAHLWNRLFFKPAKIIPLTQTSAEIARGQYLVEGPGHCAECHTPRGMFGGFNYARWLAGGKAPDGEGTVPNLTPDETGLGGRTIDDILYALEPGMTHAEARSFGVGMESVRRNIAVLPIQDRRAIAAYLMALPAVATRP